MFVVCLPHKLLSSSMIVQSNKWANVSSKDIDTQTKLYSSSSTNNVLMKTLMTDRLRWFSYLLSQIGLIWTIVHLSFGNSAFTFSSLKCWTRQRDCVTFSLLFPHLSLSLSLIFMIEIRNRRHDKEMMLFSGKENRQKRNFLQQINSSWIDCRWFNVYLSLSLSVVYRLTFTCIAFCLCIFESMPNILNDSFEKKEKLEEIISKD